MENSDFQTIGIDKGEESQVNGIKLIFSNTIEINFLKQKKMYSFR